VKANALRDDLRWNKNTRPSTTASIGVEGQTIVKTGVSFKPNGPDRYISERVQNVMNRLHEEGREIDGRFGNCAEIDAISQLLDEVPDPEHIKIFAVKVRGSGSPGGHGDPMEVCPNCRLILEELGIGQITDLSGPLAKAQ